MHARHPNTATVKTACTPTPVKAIPLAAKARIDTTAAGPESNDLSNWIEIAMLAFRITSKTKTTTTVASVSAAVFLQSARPKRTATKTKAVINAPQHTAAPNGAFVEPTTTNESSGIRKRTTAQTTPHPERMPSKKIPPHKNTPAPGRLTGADHATRTISRKLNPFLLT